MALTHPMIKADFTKNLHTAAGEQQMQISFELQKGRMLALYGPSGSGKTTLLRILAGLTLPESGSILVDNECWFDSARPFHLPAQRRPAGLVFQDLALFPHLTVKGNISYALPKGDDHRLIDELLELMELEKLKDKKPAQLSGGQQQRVALARAIARKPRILLLDEPLSSLDDEMRRRMQDFIQRAHRHYHLTTILVSHRLPEIFTLCDEVILLDKGIVRQHGSPAEVFVRERKNNAFRITGEVEDIQPAGPGFIVSVLSAGNIIKIPATPAEASTLRIGDQVILSSESFNPVLQPLR